MSTYAVLPVKSFPRAKSRTQLQAAERASLAESMVRAVLTALEQVRGLDGLLVVTREPSLAGLDVVPDPHETSHSAAAALGIAEAQRRGADRVLLVPGDCPLLDPAEVDALLASAGAGVTIVPDRHGTGTNALVLAPPDAMAPSFGPGSCERHAALARAAGVPARIARVPSLAFDVDTPADLAELQAAA